jgi:hypothetical protein
MSIPEAALFASLFLLTSCGTLSRPAPNPLPPGLCTKVGHAAPMPAGASVVQPITDAEKDAFRLFMTWVAESLLIGDRTRDEPRRQRLPAEGGGPPSAGTEDRPPKSARGQLRKEPLLASCERQGLRIAGL